MVGESASCSLFPGSLQTPAWDKPVPRSQQETLEKPEFRARTSAGPAQTTGAVQPHEDDPRVSVGEHPGDHTCEVTSSRPLVEQSLGIEGDGQGTRQTSP